MTLTIHPELIQGSDEWLKQRRGIVTASVVGQLLSISRLGAIHYPCPSCSVAELEPCQSKVNSKPIKTLHPERINFAQQQDSPPVIEPANNDPFRNLTILLAAERITGWTDPTYISDDMLRGIDDEPRARGKYAEHYAPVAEVGFMVEDRWGFQIGYSPDGLVGDDGLIEVKSRRAKIQLATIVADEVPLENMAQMQCGLLVSGREWIDYVSYSGGMPLYVKRVFPQQNWFDAIIAAVEAFEENVAEIIRTYNESIAGLHATERTIEQEIRI
jgi:hypothetical protein